jgi:hypothetical protein
LLRSHVQVRQQVQQLREAQVDLAALREELQQLQSVHDEARAHVAELRDKVGYHASCRPAQQQPCLGYITCVGCLAASTFFFSLVW